jgi:hypothetical protein
MKYTNQVINGDVNIQGLISLRKYLKPATVVMTLPIAIFGLIIFTLALIPASGMDFGRYVRLEYLRQLKIYHRVNYINEVAKSLTSDKNERDEACKLLTSML